MFRLHLNTTNTTNKIRHMFGSMSIRFIVFGLFSSDMNKIPCNYEIKKLKSNIDLRDAHSVLYDFCKFQGQNKAFYSKQSDIQP